MGQERIRRGQGQDLGGTTIRSRYEKLEERRIADKHAAAGPPRGAAPSPDERVSGSKVAHVGMLGAPNIYAESPQGREKGRGKRV